MPPDRASCCSPSLVRVQFDEAGACVIVEDDEHWMSRDDLELVGVDSKIHKGELFGISNLFRDLSETVFTSDIIEKHDERITGIHRSSSRAVEGSNNKSIVRIEEADFEDISNNSGDDIEDSDATEVISDIRDEIENSESQYDHLLKDAAPVVDVQS